MQRLKQTSSGTLKLSVYSGLTDDLDETITFNLAGTANALKTLGCF